MPAPDFETLYNVESAVETAWKTVLTAAAVSCYTQRESTDLPPARVDVQCTLGAEKSTRQLDQLARLMPCAWDFNCALVITTPRFGADSNGNRSACDPAIHARLRGLIRYLCAPILDTFDAGVLPYHVLSLISGAGSTPQVNIDEDQDISEMFFSGIVSIRAGAWPNP